MQIDGGQDRHLPSPFWNTITGTVTDSCQLLCGDLQQHDNGAVWPVWLLMESGRQQCLWCCINHFLWWQKVPLAPSKIFFYTGGIWHSCLGICPSSYCLGYSHLNFELNLVHFERSNTGDHSLSFLWRGMKSNAQSKWPLMELAELLASLAWLWVTLKFSPFSGFR